MKTARQVLQSTPAAAAYAEKLGDARWANFARSMRATKGNFCEHCKRGNVPTQVHHCFYDSNREPWDYDASEVIVLCAECHGRMHKNLSDFRALIFSRIKARPFQILNRALNHGFRRYDDLQLAYALADFILTPRSVDCFYRSALKTLENAESDLAKLVREA